MNTLLITGSDGWLGSSILDLLFTNGDKLKNIDNIVVHSLNSIGENEQNNLIFLASKKLHSQISFINGNFKNEKFFKNLNLLFNNLSTKNLYVISTVSVIHPKIWNDFILVNVVGLKNLYAVCENFNLKKFTYISSNSPFGFNENRMKFDEYSKYKPIGGYGRSKKEAEIFLLNKKKSKVITILRAPWFHGKNMPLRQKLFLMKASKGKFPLIGFGNNKRSLVNVEDLAQAAFNVTFEKRKSQIYWITEDEITMHQFLLMIKKTSKTLFKKKGKYIPISFLIRLPYGFSTFFKLIDILIQKFKIYNMYVHVFSELGQNIVASSDKYKNEFPTHKWKPIQLSIYEELKEVLIGK